MEETRRHVAADANVEMTLIANGPPSVVVQRRVAEVAAAYREAEADRTGRWLITGVGCVLALAGMAAAVTLY